MKQRTFAVLYIILGLVIAIGITGTVLGAGPVSALFGSEERHPPALVSFESAGAHCTDEFIANASTSVRSGGANTGVTYGRNISLSSPSHAVGGPTFERLNESTYMLSVPTEETSKAPRECSGVARYNASMRIPAGDDPWRIIIRHDGVNITTIYGDSDSSLTGGAASAGGNASA